MPAYSTSLRLRSGQISARPSRPTPADVVAMAVVLAVCVLSLYVELGTPLATSA